MLFELDGVIYRSLQSSRICPVLRVSTALQGRKGTHVVCESTTLGSALLRFSGERGQAQVRIAGTCWSMSLRVRGHASAQLLMPAVLQLTFSNGLVNAAVAL